MSTVNGTEDKDTVVEYAIFEYALAKIVQRTCNGENSDVYEAISFNLLMEFDFDDERAHDAFEKRYPNIAQRYQLARLLSTVNQLPSVEDKAVATNMFEPFQKCVPCGYRKGPGTLYYQLSLEMKIQAVLLWYEYGETSNIISRYPNIEELFSEYDDREVGFVMKELERLRKLGAQDELRQFLSQHTWEKFKTKLIQYLKPIEAKLPRPVLEKHHAKFFETKKKGTVGASPARDPESDSEPEIIDLIAPRDALKKSFLAHGGTSAGWEKILRAKIVMREPEAPEVEGEERVVKRKKTKRRQRPVEEHYSSHDARELQEKSKRLKEGIKDPLDELTRRDKSKSSRKLTESDPEYEPQEEEPEDDDIDEEDDPKFVTPKKAKVRQRRYRYDSEDEDFDIDGRSFLQLTPNTRPNEGAAGAILKTPNGPPLTPSVRRNHTLKGKRVAYSNEEIENLKAGIEKYGVGAWSKIVNAFAFNNRSSVDIKDKYRHLVKSGRLPKAPPKQKTSRQQKKAEEQQQEPQHEAPQQK